MKSDFVSRYGERVVAARSDRPLALFVTAILAAASLGLARLLPGGRPFRAPHGGRPGARPASARSVMPTMPTGSPFGPTHTAH